MKDNPIIDLAARLSFTRSKADLKHHLCKLYEGIDCKGKTLLDIGCGNGLFSLYARYLGASRVVGIEPDCDHGLFNRFAVGLDNVELVRARFQDVPVERYDIILLHNSIHHLSWACHRLAWDTEAREEYLSILAKMRECLSPDGTLVLLDSSNHNLWTKFGITNPFIPYIQWGAHHPPELYQTLLREVGFNHPILSWIGPVELPLDSKWGQYLLIGQFRLVMTRI